MKIKTCVVTVVSYQHCELMGLLMFKAYPVLAKFAQKVIIVRDRVLSSSV